MENAIELRGVTKRFGSQIAVNQLDLQVPRGSIYGFIGPNGSGKTTTLRMILRIFQPDAGQVIVLGRGSGQVADDRLGYLPEERGLYKRMRIRELLTYYSRLKGHYDCQADIDDWLRFLQADSWANRKIEALSKGMAQKVQFIAAVVARPELVILDEPFSGLDPVNMETLRDAVLRLRDRGTTIIFSTHDMNMAEEMCDTIFMIFRGHKVLDGSLEAIQNQYAADLIRVGFGGSDQSFPEINGVTELRRAGNCYEFRLREFEQSSRVLQQLAAVRQVVHYDVVKPSLHDIFVRIARPEITPESVAPSPA
jgi:ABC-2 type transport system ATP-binding protein